MSEKLFRFGAFAMDAELRLLYRDGAPVALGPRALALLQVLVAAGGRVVGKSELMDAGWPSQAVEESNLTVQIAALRKTLGTRPDGEEWIATVPRVGYRFLHMAEEAGDAAAAARAFETKPSIAVLPFTNLSAAREQEFFADGMTDDIIAALSRIGALFVISRGSSLAFKGRMMPAKDAARELGVRYILEGSVRAAGGQVRVTAQLTDGETGGPVWAERYEGSTADIFAVQDDITRSIVQAMQVQLSIGEAGRLWEGQSRNLRAWEKAVLGHQIFQRYSTSDNGQARRLLEEAVAIDPGFTGAMALLGITHYWDARYSITVDRTEAIAKAERQALLIETIDPELGQLCTLKSAIAFVSGKHEEAVRWSRRAVDRAPGDSRAHGFLGMFQIYSGALQEALASMKLAIRHCPYPEAYLHYYPALIHMWLGDYGRALGFAEENRRMERDEPYSAALLAAIHGFRGDGRGARELVKELLEATPSFSLRNIRHSELYREPERLERLIGVLAEAGLPD